MELALLLLTVGVVWMASKGKFSGGGGTATVPLNKAPASGTNLTQGTDLTAEIGGAVGAIGCQVVGSVYGSPAAGRAAAPLCALIGAKVAPYAAAAGKWIGEEAAAGATYVAGEAADAARYAARAAGSAVDELTHNPAASITVPTLYGAKVAGAVAGLADRGVDAAWNHSPAIVKVAALPLYGGIKVTTKAAVYATEGAEYAAQKAGAGARALYNGVNSVAGAALSWSSGAPRALGAVGGAALGVAFSGARTVGAAAGAVERGFVSGAKSAANAVGSAASAVGSALSSLNPF